MYKLLISTPTYGRSAPAATESLKQYCHITRNPYGRTLTTDEFLELARDCDAIIAGTEKITCNALEELPRLKVISRYGAGIDNIDLEAVTRLGIKLYTTPEAPTRAVAELAVCLILNATRRVPIMHADMKSGVWNKRTGFLLEGKNVGIVGFGRIGCMAAELLSSFGVNIRYHDIVRKENAFQYEPSLDALLGWSDITTLHCAAHRDGNPILGADEFALMRKNAIIVNTARGTLIDEHALYETLVNNPEMTAALDVYAEEPYSGVLMELDNVIHTPHIASAAKETRAAMDIEAAENCLKGLNI